MKAIIFLLLSIFLASTAFGAGNLLVTGNIGVGTTTPRANLEVNGTAIIRYLVTAAEYVDLAKGLTPSITSGSLSGGGPCFRGDNSRWIIDSFPASMTVDLGPNNYGYSETHILFGTQWKEDLRHAPYDYTLEGSSDGISWTTITTVTGNTNLHLVHPVHINYRYIRLSINTPQPGQAQTFIAGFQVLSDIYSELAGKEPWVVTGDNASIAVVGNVGIGTAGSPTAKLEVNGGVRINTVVSKPYCTNTTRGTFWVTSSPAGVKDVVEVCTKDQTESYVWRVIW